MIKRIKTIEDEISQLLADFGVNELNKILEDVYELFQLYDVDPETDWLKNMVLDEDLRIVRLCKTAYIISRLADRSGSSLKKIARLYPALWQRIEIHTRGSN